MLFFFSTHARGNVIYLFYKIQFKWFVEVLRDFGSMEKDKKQVSWRGFDDLCVCPLIDPDNNE